MLIGLAAAACCAPCAVSAGTATHARHTREYFRHEMAATVRADHPAIKPVADAIRAITRNPLEQIVVVNDVAHLLVDYDDDERVYGAEEFHATLDEMLARRREGGWLYLRDDCDGRAVFAAHLLAALGIEWRLEASYWKEHAWVIARVNGIDYDLLDLRKNAPETSRLSYKLLGKHFVRTTNPPPAFAWRNAWAVRTGRNLDLGLDLGLLALDSKPGALHERHATDWTVKAPGKLPPLDERTLFATTAGFPRGEALHVSALAGRDPVPKHAALAAGASTASSSSNATDAGRP